MGTMTLSAVKAGITRLREKGGASKDSLYDLFNGYVTAARTLKIRPGTVVDHTLPAGTKGLCYFRGKRHVFSARAVTMTDPKYFNDILIHPDDEADELDIQTIHFAAPVVGALYVVATFTDDNTYHYWLQQSDFWEANAVMRAGWTRMPNAANGYVYRASRIGDPYPAWAPNILRSVGDRVEPISANGYYYEVTDTDGDTPRSGATEPVWLATSGGIVVEDTALEQIAITAPSTPVVIPGGGTIPPGPGTGGSNPYDPNNPGGGSEQP